MNSIWDKRDRTIVACSMLSGALLLSKQHRPAAGWVNWMACIFISSILFSAPTFHLKMYWRVGFNYILTIIAAVIVPVSSGDLVGLAICQVLFSIIASFLLFLFPLPSACLLNGPYCFIGTTSFVMNLKTTDVHIEQKDHKFDFYNNSLSVQCWFPISYDSVLDYIRFKIFESRALLWTSGCHEEQYHESVELLNQIAEKFKLPNLILRHHSLSRMNSTWQENFLRLSNKDKSQKLPIAVYSHGMYGWRQISSSVSENLASNGFIVFAVDHAPDCMLARPLKNRKEYAAFHYYPPKGSSDMEERYFYSCGVNRRVSHIQQLLDFIVNGQLFTKYPELTGRLDETKICLWGHSFGANTVTSVSCMDSRPSKVVALDAWMYPMPNHIRLNGIQKAAFLSLSAHYWPFAKYQVPFRRDCIANSSTKRPIFDMVIKGTDHQNYCDTYLIASKHLLRRPTILGKDIDPYKVSRNLDLLISAFFSVDDPLNASSITIDPPSSTQALVKYLSCIEGRILNNYINAQSFQMFVAQFVVHESSIDGFCDQTYFEKVIQKCGSDLDEIIFSDHGIQT